MTTRIKTKDQSRAGVFICFTSWPRLALWLALALLPCAAAAQEKPQGPQAPKLVPALGWDVAKQGGFVTAVAVDAQNNVWAGTEGNGLWRHDARKKEWTQFTSKDGLGDDCIYALAVDKLGRVWAGHLNHGVSVWNGEKWKNYGLLDGPLGSRVFDIATCPKDGDVWIATENGAARYSIADDDWDYFTSASGLPSNQIQSIAFDADGDIYLGTQCDGIAMADRKSKYAKWDVAKGVDELPNAAFGAGLPSSLINGIAFVPSPKNAPFQAWPDMVYAATPYGISVSGDDGDHFAFIRGADWQETETGLLNPPAAPNPQAAAGAMVAAQRRVVMMAGMAGMGGMSMPGNRGMVMAQLLVQRAVQGNDPPSEDWVTCMRPDSQNGQLWVGYRTKGLELWNPLMGQTTHYDTGGADMDVRAIWPSPNGSALVAVYDGKNGGLKTPDNPAVDLTPGDAPKEVPALPSPAKPPAANDMDPLAKRLDFFQNELKPSDSVFTGDDWSTGGDWVNHYGTSYAMLYINERGQLGIRSDAITVPYESEPGFSSSVAIGPHYKNPADQTRTYQSQSFKHNPASGLDSYDPFYHSANRSTDNPRVLYAPMMGRRSEGEVNDRSFDKDNYPMTWEGPDLMVTVEVPKGVHIVSLYFQNYDSQEGSDNKLRDYDIEVLHPEESQELTLKGAPLARARVLDFWGGVYKRFAVAGPAKYVFHIGRNRSYVTKLLGVFIDRAVPDPSVKKTPLPGFDTVKYAAPELPGDLDTHGNPDLAAAVTLWDKLAKNADKRGVAAIAQPFYVWAYRAAAAAKAPAPLLANWRWQMGVWDEDRDAFDKAMADAFKAYPGKKLPPVKQGDVGDGN